MGAQQRDLGLRLQAWVRVCFELTSTHPFFDAESSIHSLCIFWGNEVADSYAAESHYDLAGPPHTKDDRGKREKPREGKGGSCLTKKTHTVQSSECW